MRFPTSLEPLEPRIAPATLLSPSAFSYTDVDGDAVRVSFSKPILTTANFDALVNLSGGLAGTGRQDLIGLDLLELGAAANGLNITIVANPTATLGGDGAIAGVYIDAFDYDPDTEVFTGIDLGVVKVDGDLTYIDAGDANSSTFSIRALTARSVGLSDPGVLSDIYGPVGTMRISGDFAGYFYAESNNLLYPDFKSISIRGSVLGNLGEDAGRIFAYAGIGNLAIGGDVIGGAFAETGSIRTAGPIDALSIKGSIIGGDGGESGRIRALELGTVSLRGSLIGGYGAGSGAIETYYGDINSLTIFGSIIGGRGDGAATVRAGDSFDDDGIIRSMLVRGSVIGMMPDSGDPALGLTIRADNSINRLTIMGALVNANIVAGVQPGADLIYGTQDDLLTEGFPDAQRKIGSLLVQNGVSATVPGFTITALKIAAIQAGGPVLRPGGPYANFDSGFLLGGGQGLFVVEF